MTARRCLHSGKTRPSPHVLTVPRVERRRLHVDGDEPGQGLQGGQMDALVPVGGADTDGNQRLAHVVSRREGGGAVRAVIARDVALMANPELLPQMDEAIGQVVIEGPLWSAMATVTPRSPEFWPGAALRCRWSASRPGPGARPSRCAIPPSTRW